MFQKSAEKYAQNIAILSDNDQIIRYSDILNFSDRLKKNLEVRSLVFCLCENTIGSLIGYFSFMSNGTVPLMLDASIDQVMLNSLIKIYEPNYLWINNSLLNSYANFEVKYTEFNYSLVLLSDNKVALNEQLALLLTTSGSTGSPKLVRLSYENIQANAESIAEYLSIDEHERPITTLPMNYSFGLSIINSHLLKGATILLTSKSLMEKGFWDFLRTREATSMSGVPYTFEILKKLRFFRMDIPSLKTLTQAGGKLNNELNKEFAEFCQQSSKRFFVMYGQTEATARMSYLPPEYSLSKLGSMGIAIPGGVFSLIDESGTNIEGNDITGELVYRGKNVSMGYAECASNLQKGDENHGILLTGDLAKRDSDNFYTIVGRKKRFIKLFGNRVNLDETERILKSFLTDCACTGEDDHMKIYITDKTRIDEVRTFISSKTGIHHSAFTIIQIDIIPKNPSGKTIYSDLGAL